MSLTITPPMIVLAVLGLWIFLGSRLAFLYFRSPYVLRPFPELVLIVVSGPYIWFVLFRKWRRRKKAGKALVKRTPF